MLRPLHNRNYSIDFDGTRSEENRVKLEADRVKFYKPKSRKHVKAFIEESDKLSAFRVSANNYSLYLYLHLFCFSKFETGLRIHSKTSITRWREQRLRVLHWNCPQAWTPTLSWWAISSFRGKCRRNETMWQNRSKSDFKKLSSQQRNHLNSAHSKNWKKNNYLRVSSRLHPLYRLPIPMGKQSCEWPMTTLCGPI